MKTTTTKNQTAPIAVMLKAIELELKTILENDICKLHLAEDARIKEAAFLQLIAA